MQKYYENTNLINFKINYDNFKQQRFQMNPEINQENDNNIEFFINLNNKFMSNDDKYIRTLSYPSFQTISRMLEFKNIDEKIQIEKKPHFRKTIKFSKVKSLDTINKYNYIFNKLQN